MNEAYISYNGKLYTKYKISQMQQAMVHKVHAAKHKYLAECAAGIPV